MQHIVLTGFMGSGKSTIGRLLANQIQWAFADLDSHIEARLQLSVPQIFAQHGEPVFRDAEARELARLLDLPRQVIALGGGAPCMPAVRELLCRAPGVVTVYLQAPFPVLYQRCVQQSLHGGAVERPLLGPMTDAHARYQARLSLYAEVAQYTFNVDGETPATLATKLANSLGLVMAGQDSACSENII